MATKRAVVNLPMRRDKNGYYRSCINLYGNILLLLVIAVVVVVVVVVVSYLV